ncbi:SDR family oxidoreductase [Streptomyces misionensis]|uniref:SDR family NAD(P)-dependent oxidoreductase n=1 Tax=Streptomyces misionensis TaxID=67331 RepID=UPI003415C34E
MRGRAGAGLTGPEGGVGHAIARALVRHGAAVAVLDRDAEAANRTVDAVVKDGGEAFRGDAEATRDEDCRRAVTVCAQRFGGRLDVLVNNVASGERSGLFEVGTDDWDRLMDVNLKSAWLMTRHAPPRMGEGSAIVTISSVGARRPDPGVVYSVAKAGLDHLTKGTASTLGPRGIRVNCLQIGAIWPSMAARNIPAEAREAAAAPSFSARRGRPETLRTRPCSRPATRRAGSPGTSSPSKVAVCAARPVERPLPRPSVQRKAPCSRARVRSTLETADPPPRPLGATGNRNPRTPTLTPRTHSAVPDPSMRRVRPTQGR